MALYIVLLIAAVWRIHQNDIKLVIVRIVQYIFCQRVAVIDLGRVDIMQQHIGDAEHVRELLLLDAIDRLGIFFAVFSCLHLLVKGFQP